MILLKQHAEWTVPHLDKNRADLMALAIESAGRTAYQSEPAGDPYKFLSMLVKRGHLSVIEHVSLTARLVTDRAITHELVRHRIGVAYTQESTRFVDYNGNKQGHLHL